MYTWTIKRGLRSKSAKFFEEYDSFTGQNNSKKK